MLVLIAFVVLSNSTFVTVNAGERGVLFKKFAGGLDKENIYGEGFHFVLPWNDLIKYQVRETVKQEEMNIILGEGLTITMDIAIRYRPEANKIGYLHQDFGEDFEEIVVTNSLRSVSREVASKFTPEEVYSTKKEQVRIQIEELMAPLLKTSYLTLVRVDLRDIQLPETYSRAIGAKLEREQDVLRERQESERILIEAQAEADRKLIEANAIREFQEIISEGISDKYLRLKGIEATLELAKSENSKVIIVGSGEDGLPLILGGEK